MDNMPSIAITGTPAVGKTAVSALLGLQGWEVATVAELAKLYMCEGKFDELMDSLEIDIHKLSEQYDSTSLENTIIDGHLSHFLDVDAIVILRCAPEVLRTRLTSRGYDEVKINANVEWEMVAGTWSEILEFEINKPILELDSSQFSPEQIAFMITEWLDDDYTLPEGDDSSAIDWLAD